MFESGFMLALCGGIIGLIIGYTARKSHFCTMAALERHWYANDTAPLRTWVLAAFTALVSTQVLLAMNLITPQGSFYLTSALPLGGAILGGIMFGMGMALVGTCGFGALIRLGGGNLRALVVLTGLGLAALTAQRGITAYFRTYVLDHTALDLTPYGGQSAGALLSHITGLNLGLPLALTLGAAGLYWIFKSASFRRDQTRILAGTMIGLCITAGWVITSWYESHSLYPVQIESSSFVMPVGDTIFQIIVQTGTFPDYGIGMVIGVFMGAALCAIRSRDMRWEACDDARELGRHLFGAFLMGTGGVFALGCTIGQGVSAFSLMAISAPIVMLSIALGARMGLSMLLEGNPFSFIADWRTAKHPLRQMQQNDRPHHRVQRAPPRV